MTTGLSATQANAYLNSLTRAAAYTAPAAFFIKLHLGDPGSAGTANAAAETTRKAIGAAAASGGSTSNSADILWTSYPAAETVSHVSFWDASTAGVFLGSKALTASKTMAIGNTLTLSAAAVVIAITPIAA